ncbi:MAG: FAD-binding oxidoreductase [Alphaproteobacteria bacterium]
MTARPTAQTLDRLKNIVGDGGWRAAPDDLAHYLDDQRGLFHGAAPLVLLPCDTDQVARIVAVCHATGTALVPQGGNTGLVGGSVPDESGHEIVVSLSRLNRIRGLSTANDTIAVEAGCILADIQAAARDADRLFPLSLGAEGSCQIGGNLATNAGGVNVLRYGNARDLVLGLEVVLPDGRIWDGMRALRKDNTGYALKHLFVGAEGTLGIITAAVLKLFPLPKDTTTAFVAVPDIAAGIALLRRLQGATGEQVSAFELLSRFALDLLLKHVAGSRDPLAERHTWYVLFDVAAPDRAQGARAAVEETLAAAIADGIAIDATIAQSQAQAAAFWRLRETIPEAQTREGASIKHDVAVPIDAFAALVERGTAAALAAVPGARPCIFGHLGDGNAHFNITQPEGMAPADFLARWDDVNARIHDIAHDLGGSISAEHGLGRLKRDTVLRYKSDVEIDLMRTLKRALDPQGILNPGKVVDLQPSLKELQLADEARGDLPVPPRGTRRRRPSPAD